MVSQIELNEDTRFILGRPNFWCGAMANSLRALGHEIPNKAEEEQAYVIWWMLNLYMENGEGWKGVANALLKAEPVAEVSNG
jgi:hypothetical protein